MTVAARNPHPDVTDGERVRVGVRAPETRRVVPIRPDLNRGSAHARAIPDNGAKVKTDTASKVRNFASQHAGEAADAAASSWLANDQPRPLRDVAQTVIHPQGVRDLPAAMFRLAVYAIAYLMCSSVDTNKRAAVTFALLSLSLLTAWAIAALAG